MIMRMWRGHVRAARSAEYLEFLKRTGFKDYAATPGNRGVYAFHRVVGDRGEFLLVTLWDSMEAVKAFAGPYPEKAFYYPEDRDFLLELEPTVAHYEVVHRA